MEELSLKKTNSPIFYFSKFVGLIVFTPETTGMTQKHHKFILDIVWFLYAIVYLGIYFMCLSFCLIDAKESRALDERFPMITLVGHLMFTVCGAFIMTILFCYSSTNFKCIENILNHLERIDGDLNSVTRQDKVDYEAIYNFQIRIIIASGISFVVTSIYDTYVFEELFQTHIVFILVDYIVPFVCGFVVQFQFVVAVYNIFQRFKLVNKYLTSIANVNKPTSKAVSMYRDTTSNDFSASSRKPQTLPFIISDDKKLQLEDIEDERPPSYTKVEKAGSTMGSNLEFNPNLRNPPVKNTYVSVLKSKPDNLFVKNSALQNLKADAHADEDYKYLHLKMNELFTLHDKLCDIAEIINDTFAVQLVVTITCGFVIILFGFFFETKVLFWTWGNNLKFIMIATAFVVWGVIMTASIYLTLRYCTAAKEESNESALIVHKILQNKPAFMLNDEIYYSKMKSFTLQVLHRKNTFHFNGLGLFRLDYTFIFSVVSAATSYLIVLLQFDLSDDLSQSFGTFLPAALNSTTTAIAIVTTESVAVNN